MAQIRIQFGVDGKKSSGGPLGIWNNIKLKKSVNWNAAFVEIDGKSYGPVLRPTQDHTLELDISVDYQTQILINRQPVYSSKHYISADLVVSLTNKDANANTFIEYIPAEFYDH